MGRMLRSVGAVIAGLAAGAAVVAGVDAVSSTLYPPPAGADPSNMEALRAYVASLPAGAFLFVLLAWAAGSLVGAWVATRLGPSRNRVHGLVIGVLLLASGIFNMVTLPHPAWFWAASLVVFPVFTYLGIRLAAGRPGSGGARATPA